MKDALNRNMNFIKWMMFIAGVATGIGLSGIAALIIMKLYF